MLSMMSKAEMHGIIVIDGDSTQRNQWIGTRGSWGGHQKVIRPGDYFLVGTTQSLVMTGHHSSLTTCLTIIH